MNGIANGPTDDDDVGVMLCFYFFSSLVNLFCTLLGDCIDYIRCFYSFCLDVFAATRICGNLVCRCYED